MKRMISLLLVLAMLVSYLPMTSRAEGAENTEPTAATEAPAETEAPAVTIEPSAPAETEPVVETTAPVEEETEPVAENDVPSEKSASEEATETLISKNMKSGAVIASGECGKNLTWVLDDGGTLTISGTGKMDNWYWDYYDEQKDAPWKQHRSQILSVVISEGVTNIGGSAFAYCRNLTSVTIPNSVVSIDTNAFNGCAFTEITIPDSVTAIGGHAFESCQKLISVEIPDGVKEIALSTFENCKALTQVIIPFSVTFISNSAFQSCTSLEIITIPSSVTRIAAEAFSYCSNLKNVNIPEGVTTIDTECFSNCSNLITVNIPGSVSSIGKKAFYNCPNLKRIWVEESNANYSSDFSGVLFDKNKTVLYQANSGLVGSYTIPDSVKTIEEFAFAFCGGLQNVTIPNSVTTIGTYAFFSCNGLTNVKIPDSVKNMDTAVFTSCKNLTSVTISGGLSRIPESTFSSCGKLNSVIIPASLKGIANDAFSSCSRIKEVYYLGTEAQWQTLKNNTGSGNGYFLKATVYCNWVEPLASGSCGTNLSWALDEAGILTIRGTGKMTNYAAPGTTGGSNGSGDLDAPWYSLRSQIKGLKIEEGVTGIGEYAFYGLNGITEVIIPKSVTTIGEDAFRECTALLRAEILGPVESINYNVFNGCNNLEELILHDGVKGFRDHALEGCTKLKHIRIPDSLKTIPMWLFEDCDLIATAGPIGSGCDLEYGWKTALPKNAFFALENLKEISWPTVDQVCTIQTIGEYAFAHCSSLNEISLPYGVQQIYRNAFFNCNGLSSVICNNSLFFINESAFANCTRLTDIYFFGTQEEWNRITVAYTGNAAWRDATLHLLGQEQLGIFYYSEWHEGSQTVGLYNAADLMVTEETDRGFVENPEALLGQYVIATILPALMAGTDKDVLLNMTLADMRSGYVEAVNGDTIKINGTVYTIPANVSEPEKLLNRYVLFFMHNDAILQLEALEVMEALFVSWNPETRKLTVEWDIKETFPMQCQVISGLDTETREFLESCKPGTVVRYHEDKNGIVHTVCDEIIDGEFSYLFDHDGLGVLNYTFHYDEGWFDKDSAVYQHDLARMSLRVAMATGDTRRFLDEDPNYNMQKLMKDLGFTYSEQYSSYPEAAYNTIGYSMGSKDIISPSGERSTLVLVAIRGFGYYGEWAGNFWLGDGFVHHEGFNEAAMQVRKNMLPYLDELRTQKSDQDIKLWICGYSRAGATANLVAARMIDIPISYVPPENIFAFCFECPKNTTDTNSRNSKYDRIVNIINPIDLVPQVAMRGLGFDRYGTDYYLPNAEATANYMQLRDPIYKTYTSILEYVMPTTEALRRATKYLDELVDQARKMEQASDNLADFMESRRNYCIKYQGLVMDAVSKVFQGSIIQGELEAMGDAFIALYENWMELLGLAAKEKDLIAAAKTGTLANAHLPTLCLAWMDTVDNLTPEANRDRREFTVNCDADIAVYREGKLVAQIINDVPQKVEGGIPALVDYDGQKTVILPGDATYDIQLTSRKNSKLNAVIIEKDTSVSGSTHVIGYLDLLLYDGDVVTAFAGDMFRRSSARYALFMPDGTEITPTFVQSGDEVENFSIRVTEEGSGTALGGGKYVRGEFARVTVEPVDDCHFVGWYVNGECISRDPEYRFQVNADLELTAKFVDTVNQISISQEYIAMKQGDIAHLDAEVLPEELAYRLHWDVEQNDRVISVDDEGNVTAYKPGTAYVIASVAFGEDTFTARCRVDVAETEAVEEEQKIQLTGIQLNTTKAVSELNSTDYAKLEVLLKLPQNYKVKSVTRKAQIPEDLGVAIESARFTDETMAKYFSLIPQDDRTLAIVPTMEAITNPKEVKSSYKSTIAVTVEGQEHVSEELSLSVKKSAPKLKATIPAFNSFYAGQAQEMVITGATVAAVEAVSVPEWLTLEGQTLTLNENAPAQSVSGKVGLLVYTEEWRIPTAVTLSVKNSYKAATLKLSASSVTLNTSCKDQASVMLTANPADFDISDPVFRLMDSTGKTDKTGELTVAYQNGQITVGTTEQTNGNYKLFVSVGKTKSVALTVKTISKTPTVSFKVTGNPDISIPGSEAQITPTFKNYSGDFTLVSEENPQFVLTQVGKTIRVSAKNGTVTGSYPLTLKLKLADDTTVIAGTAKVSVKETALKLKLSASKLTLNKTISDKAEITVTSATKGYVLTKPVWTLMDKGGKNPAEGKLNISWNNGKLVIEVNDATEYNASYRLLVKAGKDHPAQTLTVTVLAEAKSAVTATLKASGGIDVIRDGSSVTVTPSYKNSNTLAKRTERIVFYKVVGKNTEPANSLFAYASNGKGGYTVTKADGAQLDHSAKYQAVLVTVFGEACEVKSKPVTLSVKQGSSKMTLTAADSYLFSQDKYDRAGFVITAADKTQNKIAKIKIKDAKYQNIFELVDYGNGEYAIGFAGGTVDSSLIGKTVTVNFNIFIEGNQTSKANTTAKLKLTIIQ